MTRIIRRIHQMNVIIFVIFCFSGIYKIFPPDIAETVQLEAAERFPEKFYIFPPIERGITGHDLRERTVCRTFTVRMPAHSCNDGCRMAVQSPILFGWQEVVIFLSLFRPGGGRGANVPQACGIHRISDVQDIGFDIVGILGMPQFITHVDGGFFDRIPDIERIVFDLMEVIQFPERSGCRIGKDVAE